MKSRLAAALAERAVIDRRLEEAEVAPAVALHPNLPESYRRNGERLADALAEPGMEAGEARIAPRTLIELIMSEPRADGRDLDLLVHPRLAQILYMANDRPELGSGDRVSAISQGVGS